MDERVAATAEAIRKRLGEKVSAPGLRAIRAVLMLRKTTRCWSATPSGIARQARSRSANTATSFRAQSSIAGHGAANPVLLSESSVSDQPASEVRPCSALRCCFCRYPPLKVRLRIRVLVSCSRLRLSACVSFLAHGRLTSLFSCPSSPLIGLCYTSPTSRCCIVRLSSSVKVSTASQYHSHACA